MSREIVISDLHGCVDELETMVDRLQLAGDDHVVFVGDLIDKGPDSIGVINLVQELQAGVCKVTLLLGNHEEKFLRWLAHEENRVLSGKQNPMLDYTGRFEKLASTLNDQQLQFLRSARLWSPLAATIKDTPVIVTHAGIKPGLLSLPPEDANRSSMSAKKWREAESLVRVRRIDADGKPVRLGEERPTDSFWANLYDGRFGIVIFGHEAELRSDVSRFPFAIGIDLGCVYGGHLAAIIFNPPCQNVAPDFETMLIKAKCRYQPKRSMCHDLE